jgi:hypothetical protein
VSVGHVSLGHADGGGPPPIRVVTADQDLAQLQTGPIQFGRPFAVGPFIITNIDGGYTGLIINQGSTCNENPPVITIRPEVKWCQ